MYKILSKLVDECRRYSKPQHCHFRAWLKRPIFGVHHSQGSAETSVRRGGITNHHLIACSFINTSAKNYQMCIEVIVCNISVVFLRQCRSVCEGCTNKKQSLSLLVHFLMWYAVVHWIFMPNKSNFAQISISSSYVSVLNVSITDSVSI